MTQRLTHGIAAAFMLASVFGFAPVASAEDVECRETIGAVTITGNLIVPDDATCTLEGTMVDGNITVKSRATLTANEVSVTGGVQGESASSVTINPDSSIGNNVSLRKGVDVSIDGASITGDIQLEENTGLLSIVGNEIVGNVQANKNQSEGLTISSNIIGNNLQCQDNSPPPTGGDNVAKQKEGQCANL